MKRLLLGLSVVLIATAVLGCTSAPEAPTTLPASTTLRILGTAEEEYVRGLARAFELDTGIKTTYVRLSSGEGLAKIREQRDFPQFSVWWGGPADAYIAAAAEGLLQPYKPRGFDKLPKQYKDENGAWTGVYVGALAFAVNTRVLEEEHLPEPTSWADLIKPIYRNQISMGHPATSGTAFTTISTIVQLHDKDVARGFAYLEALNQNIREYQRAGALPARIAGQGDVAIGIVFSHDIIAAIGDGATDLKVVFPSEGTGYEIGGMALLQKAPEPDAGRMFMDWVLTEKAQELGPLFSAYQIPTNPDAKVPQKSVRLSEVKTIDYDFDWAGDFHDTLVTRFSTRIAPPPKPSEPSRVPEP